jgi:dipeptide/tripeptide permease
MTAGEILFSVTGLEFAFREAPDSMKSVVTSCWLLTTAVGNLLTVCLNICLLNIYMFLLTCFFFVKFKFECHTLMFRDVT